LLTAELTGTANDVTVTQGASVNFTILVSASGNVDEGTTHSATVDTVYVLSASGVLTSGTPSSPLAFFPSDCNAGGNCKVAWTGAPTPYSVSASISAASATPVGTYTIVLSEAANTTDTYDSNTTGGKLDDTTATSITVHVVAPTVTNRAPTADAGGDYAGNEGSAIALDGSGSSDLDVGDSLTYEWDVETGAPCSFSSAASASPSITCSDNGTFTVTLTVTDGEGLKDSDTAEVVVANVAPVVGTVLWVPASPVSCGPNNATLHVPFADAGSSDTHTGSVTWGDGGVAESLGTVTDGFSASHTYNSGTYTMGSVSVTDDDGGSDTENLPPLTVLYQDSGIRQPINTDGSSTFKLGSTIPVKIQFTDCDNAVIDSLTPTISLARVDSTPDAEVNEAPPAASADAGNVMRWSVDGQQYIFNLSTKRSQFAGGSDLAQGSYRLRIYIGSTLYETATFSIRK
jgi:hypothetical protein